MKISVEIDCTPAEMRAFFGLPDVEPMQQAVMSEMERQLVGAMDQFSPASLMRDWFAPMTATQQAFLNAFTRPSATGETGEGSQSSSG
ncbi:DUF6489 family protein [Mobilicoccus caccae]|uniref:Uncharacterized protein n=1 Tax=Mobilicoccus caccae TaxID=1859295 RepID=A0ABQ6IT76_9MICO|nr:DUF6489 family protein [Mobilicoccus caccae]GMA40575.1 hypothetical protein GCM10025883_26200 [Mobilicoccus caccae]